MTDLTLPPSLFPSSQRFGVSTQTARFSTRAPTQRIGRKNPRFICSMTFNNLDEVQRRQMMAFIAEAEGGLRSFAVPYFGEANKPWITDYITQQTDLTQAPWSESVQARARFDSGTTRISRSDAVSSAVMIYQLSLTTNIPYAIQIVARQGSSDGSARAYLGTTSGAADLIGITVVEGRMLLGYETNGTPSDYFLTVGMVPGAKDGHCFVDYVSVSKTAKVVSGGQTGRTLYGTTSDVGDDDTVIARKGEFFEINGEFKMLTQDMRTFETTGEFICHFWPPLRDSPAADDIIILKEPRCKMILNEALTSWSERPHVVTSTGIAVSDFTLNCIEVI